MKRTKVTAAVLAGMLAATVLASTALAAPSGTVTVTAHVRAFAAITQIDAQRLTVQSNVPWTLEIIGTDGAVTRLEGCATAGTAIAVPADAATYSLAWD